MVGNERATLGRRVISAELSAAKLNRFDADPAPDCRKLLTVAPIAPTFGRRLSARSAPIWILAAPALHSARALNALLPSMEGAIGTATIRVTAGAPSAISLIEEGCLAARPLRAGD